MGFAHPTYKPLEPGQDIETTGEILAYAAAAFPHKVGLVDGGRSWSFAEFDALANRFAHAVIATFAKHDGPVGIMGKNSAEYLIAHFGTARTGRYTINFPTRCTPEELAYTVNLTKPAVLVVEAGCRDIVAAAHERFEIAPKYVSIGDVLPDTLSEFWAFLADRSAAPPAIDIDPDAAGSVIFTGGTTGKPKAVVASQRARAVSAMSAVEDFRIDGDIVAGYSVPFTHTAGLFSWMQPAVLAGCTGVVIPKWDPARFMELAERHRISVIFAVPSQLPALLAHPAFDPTRLRSLMRIVFGAAPLSRDLIERAEEAMPWLSCERAYGSSETGHLAAQIKADRAMVYDGYNQPGGRLEIEIFKAPGVPAGEGEVGEVATRGSHLMTGYLDNAVANQAFRKSDVTDGAWGWLGDLAVRHKGYFTLVGRSKHMILSGGLNIFPVELEEILAGHPDVADCVVFGMDDPNWGELPVAAVVPGNAGVDTAALMDFVAERVARYKRLRRIFMVDEIPRTGAGKAQVHVIKERCLKADDEGEMRA